MAIDLPKMYKMVIDFLHQQKGDAGAKKGMKIAIIGYGRMGHEIERIAKAKGIGVSATIDPAEKNADFKEITKKTLSGCDVAIDFSSSGSAIGNIRKVSEAGKNMVVGTTGWYGSLDEAKEIIRKSGTGLVYSPNFSIGVNIFLKIVGESSRLFDKAVDYDTFVYEGHHSQKADSPSGTAMELGNMLIKNIKRKKKLVFDRLDRKILPEELHVASFRAGCMPGMHVVGFDSEADTIELRHTARSRVDFASGALMAAEWIKNRKGFYGIQDFMREFFQVGVYDEIGK